MANRTDLNLRRLEPRESAHLDPVCVSCTAPEDDPLTFAVSDYWKLALHPDQTVPGALLIVSLRHVRKVSELDEREALEFFSLYRLVERALEDGLGASLVNLSCLRNWAYRADNADPPWLDGRPNPHVHWHVAPRYVDPVSLCGATFIDEDFGEELIWRGRRANSREADAIVELLSTRLELR